MRNRKQLKLVEASDEVYPGYELNEDGVQVPTQALLKAAAKNPDLIPPGYKMGVSGNLMPDISYQLEQEDKARSLADKTIYNEDFWLGSGGFLLVGGSLTSIGATYIGQQLFGMGNLVPVSVTLFIVFVVGGLFTTIKSSSIATFFKKRGKPVERRKQHMQLDPAQVAALERFALTDQLKDWSLSKTVKRQTEELVAKLNRVPQESVEVRYEIDRIHKDAYTLLQLGERGYAVNGKYDTAAVGEGLSLLHGQVDKMLDDASSGVHTSVQSVLEYLRSRI